MFFVLINIICVYSEGKKPCTKFDKKILKSDILKRNYKTLFY